MKKNPRYTIALLLAVISLPLLYLAIIYNRLPAEVSMHFNGKLIADRTGDKSELWMPVLVLAGLSVLVLFLLRNLPRLDPKRTADTNPSSFHKLGAALAIIITALNFLIIASATRGATPLKIFLFPLLGLMFAVLGNYMYTIKPNYFAGFRLPWTLSDDDNWRKTHRLAGRLWFWVGLTVAVAGFFIPSAIILPSLTIVSLVISLIPAIYSYRLFKHKE